jgi:hypothetical protein
MGTLMTELVGKDGIQFRGTFVVLSAISIQTGAWSLFGGLPSKLLRTHIHHQTVLLCTGRDEIGNWIVSVCRRQPTSKMLLGEQRAHPARYGIRTNP